MASLATLSVDVAQSASPLLVRFSGADTLEKQVGALQQYLIECLRVTRDGRAIKTIKTTENTVQPALFELQCDARDLCHCANGPPFHVLANQWTTDRLFVWFSFGCGFSLLVVVVGYRVCPALWTRRNLEAVATTRAAQTRAMRYIAACAGRCLRGRHFCPRSAETSCRWRSCARARPRPPTR